MDGSRGVHPDPARGHAGLDAPAGGDGRGVEPVPEPDRAGPAPAVGGDPPADRQGAARSRPRACTSGPASSTPTARPTSSRCSEPSSATRCSTAEQKHTLLAVYEQLRRPSTNGGRAVAAPPSRPAPDPAPWRSGLDGLALAVVPNPPLVPARPRSTEPHRAPVGRALAPHVAPRPAGLGRQRRHERLRARAGVGAGPGRRRVHHATCGAGRDDLPDEVVVEPGFRVVHVDAGPPTCPKEDAAGGRRRVRRRGRSTHLAATGRRRRRPRQLLAVGRRRPPPQARARRCRSCRRSTRSPGSRPRPATPSRSAGREAEAEIIGCADAICVSCTEEEHQFRRALRRPAGPHRDRGPRRRARLLRARRPSAAPAGALGLGDRPVLLFVGRIQPLKGARRRRAGAAPHSTGPTPCS